MSRFLLTTAFVTLLSAAPSPHARAQSFQEFDRKAKAGERLNVVFHGASLTWGANASDPQLTSYRALIGKKLEQKYPQARFKFWDAAIGGTGSQLGLFRLDRDVLKRSPDLVFLDFSANDGINNATPETLASYEAIVRRLIEGRIPVVLVILPFQWDVAKGSTAGMARRDAHLAIAKAYQTGVGDAISLAQERVRANDIKIGQLWPYDGVHPGDKGYELFADAAWAGFEQALGSRLVCEAPAKTLHAPTYLTSARVRLSSLESPEGWRVGGPNVVSAYFDMLMSRWLDDEVIASSKGAKVPDRLRLKFRGSMIMLFGESTPKSGKYRVFIDGKLIERRAGKEVFQEFDAGDLGKRMNANAHLVQVLAEGLDPEMEHTLEIEPVFAAGVDQELRFESVCVAGKNAAVTK